MWTSFRYGARLASTAVRRDYSISIKAAMSKDSDLVRGFETVCLHGGYLPDAGTTSRGIPIYRTAPYVFPSTERAANLFALAELGNIYTRLMNPTTDILEKRFAALSGAHELGGLAVASGTSACFYSIINLAQAGDNIVSSQHLYGGTYTQFNDILPSLGITVKFVDINDSAAIAAAIDSKTRAMFTETVGNPSLEIAPLSEIAEVANSHKIPLIVDDTFTTPYLCKPIADYGAHIVVHSLTKWTGGHGTGIGGIVVDSGKFDWKNSNNHPLYTAPDPSYGGIRWGVDLPEPLLPLAYILRMRTVPLRNLGACISPDNSWLFLQGIETLPLRMERHCQNAKVVAEYLQKHNAVEWVRFPGLPTDSQYEKNLRYLKGKGGSLVVFEIKGGKEKGQQFIDSLKLWSHVANVGDCKSLAIHPTTTTHSQLSAEQQAAAGITPGLVRLSVGIETIEDILEDLAQALEKSVG
jgi:O-acetylhomoserine (thiol)-lyase